MEDKLEEKRCSSKRKKRTFQKRRWQRDFQWVQGPPAVPSKKTIYTIYYIDKYILSPRRHRAAFNTKRHEDSDGVLDQDTPAGKRKRFALMQ